MTAMTSPQLQVNSISTLLLTPISRRPRRGYPNPRRGQTQRKRSHPLHSTSSSSSSLSFGFGNSFRVRMSSEPLPPLPEHRIVACFVGSRRWELGKCFDLYGSNLPDEVSSSNLLSALNGARILLYFEGDFPMLLWKLLKRKSYTLSRLRRKQTLKPILHPSFAPVPSPIDTAPVAVPASSPIRRRRGHHRHARPHVAAPSPLKEPACDQICAEPLTAIPFCSPCGCVFPMKVRLLLDVAPYDVFPVMSELEIEIAAGTYLDQSQVKIMGASADSLNPGRTIVDVNLVPLGEKFDNTTADLIYERMKIGLGAARGLAYLHEDSNPRVIHRDFKASNVSLEHDFTLKVSDFGLAREATEGSFAIFYLCGVGYRVFPCYLDEFKAEFSRDGPGVQFREAFFHSRLRERFYFQ
ncbi:hypothetical protein CRG98_043531 [Punica granatum]|uniref:Protein kinase domain-containing protein n=1 Tax=Punica granatum TaxID=22663 RepID=A0A2I0HX04_PUNGR|nr:hypothetical protein CRG98_043531 [Punica granatum]